MLWLWNSFRHRNQDDLQSHPTRVRKISETVIHFIRTSLRASPLLPWSMLKSRILQGFDLPVPTQLVHATLRAAGSTTRKDRRHRPLTTCSRAHTKSTWNRSRKIVRFRSKHKIYSLCKQQRNDIRQKRDTSRGICVLGLHFRFCLHGKWGIGFDHELPLAPGRA
jgi:hypothetical protein